MYFSKEQRKFIKKIKRGKINTLNDFYIKILKKNNFIKKAKPIHDIQLYLNNKKVIISKRASIFIPKFSKISIEQEKSIKTNQIILKVREFVELWKYLENEKFIYSERIIEEDDNIIYLCKNNEEIFDEILYPIKDIYNKKMIKSTRINDFKGFTINETLQHFQKRTTNLAIIISIMIPLIVFFLNAYQAAIISFIKNVFILFKTNKQQIIQLIQNNFFIILVIVVIVLLLLFHKSLFKQVYIFIYNLIRKLWNKQKTNIF